MNGFLFNCTLQLDSKEKILKKRGLDDNGKVQQFIDSTVLQLNEPFIPFDLGTLFKSGKIHTKIGSGQVIYNTPYARRWYYMPARFEGGSGSGTATIGRGNYWFERMKAQYKDQILEGACKIAGADKG